MTKQEIKHAEALRNLGFRKDTPRSPRHIRRKTARLSAKGKLMPTFTRFEMFTLATDETGQLWRSDSRVDLTPLGFRDNVAWFSPTNSKGRAN
jgi:hypothetical protein